MFALAHRDKKLALLDIHLSENLEQLLNVAQFGDTLHRVPPEASQSESLLCNTVHRQFNAGEFKVVKL